MGTITNYGTYTGAVKINSNLIFSALFNMIISQQVFADNVKGTYSELVDRARVDGTLYGDTKLYYATDVLKTRPFLGDAEASNLLSVNRPKAPEVQAITMDVFRQVDITVDNYLTKQAWSDEGTFSSFNSVILGWIRETKKVYDSTTYNSYIGTTESSVQGSLSIGTAAARANASTELEADRLEALTTAKFFANLIDDMRDVSRKYNDYSFLRSYETDDLEIVISNDFANQLTKIDLPTIFHKDGLDITSMMKKLPKRYFGTLITSSNVSTYSDATPTTGKPIDSDTGAYTPGENNANGIIRSAIEAEVTVGATVYHVFPGDEIPSGATIGASSTNFLYGEVYIEDAEKVAVVMHKRSVPYMSAFEVGTSFFNPRSLTENHYLTFGHNTLNYLKNYPFLVIKK